MNFMDHRVAWVNFIMCAIMLCLCTTVGCLLYAKYHQCDPLRAKLISKPDQVRTSREREKEFHCLF